MIGGILGASLDKIESIQRSPLSTLPAGILSRRFRKAHLCVPKIRFCNIGGEGRRELGVI
jgi:hypothetical protein